MKLCPQCQFIYEDDQNLCDMDGEALVYDNRLGVFPGILPAATGRRPTKPRLRFRVVSTIAALVFPALLCLAYYASSPLWDSKPRSRSLGAETSETSRSPQTAPLQNNFSSPAANPSQSPTNPKAAPESGSVNSDELPETPARVKWPPRLTRLTSMPKGFADARTSPIESLEHTFADRGVAAIHGKHRENGEHQNEREEKGRTRSYRGSRHSGPL